MCVCTLLLQLPFECCVTWTFYHSIHVGTSYHTDSVTTPNVNRRRLSATVARARGTSLPQSRGGDLCIPMCCHHASAAPRPVHCTIQPRTAMRIHSKTSARIILPERLEASKCSTNRQTENEIPSRTILPPPQTLNHLNNQTRSPISLNVHPPEP